MLKIKSFMIVLVAAVVASCSLIPDDFDNVEFSRLAELNVLASEPLDGKNWCGSADIGMLNYNAKVLAVYSEHTLNENIASIYSEIADLTQELYSRENPSNAYCKIKRNNIANATQKALDVFGGRRK